MSITLPARPIEVKGNHLLSLVPDDGEVSKPVLVRAHRRALPIRTVVDTSTGYGLTDYPQLDWEHGNGYHIDAADSECVACTLFGDTPSPSEMRAALALRNRLNLKS